MPLSGEKPQKRSLGVEGGKGYGEKRINVKDDQGTPGRLKLSGYDDVLDRRT